MNGQTMDDDSGEFPCPPEAGKPTMPTNHGPTGKAAHGRAIGHKTGRAADHAAPAHKPLPNKGT